MNRAIRFCRLPFVVAWLMLILAACGAPAATPQPIEPTAARRAWQKSSRHSYRAHCRCATQLFVSKPSGQKTASGFECPEPQPKLPVTSKALNLFVWSEYIPQDMLDCFEKVYGITINRSEFSSNEEMYAKLAQGSSQFDLAQPSDYIIEVMVPPAFWTNWIRANCRT